MKIEINNGRVIDPRNGVDQEDLAFYCRGQGRGDRLGAAGLARQPGDRRRRADRLPRIDRYFRAPARAGLRIQGDPGIGAASGDRRRRDEPCLPARHRPAAGRARPGRDAEAPRSLAQPGARVSRSARSRPGSRATRSPKWASSPTPAASRFRRPTRRWRTRRCCCARCSTPRPSAIASGCGRRTRICPGAASRTTARSRCDWGCRRFRPAPRRSRSAPSSRWLASPARACIWPGCRRTKASPACARRSARASRVTCDVAINHLHLCDADIGWFDAQCHLVPPLRGVARPRGAARRARRRHHRSCVLRSHASR